MTTHNDPFGELYGTLLRLGESLMELYNVYGTQHQAHLAYLHHIFRVRTFYSRQ